LIDKSTISASGGTVGTGGADRVDNFTVSGTAIPDSLSGIAGLGCVFGLLAVLRRITRFNHAWPQKIG
jgi:hypothetical protein